MRKNGKGPVVNWACPVCATLNRAGEPHQFARCSNCLTSVRLSRHDWWVDNHNIFVRPTPNLILPVKAKANGPAHLYPKGLRPSRAVCGILVEPLLISRITDKPCANCQRLSHNVYQAEKDYKP